MRSGIVLRKRGLYWKLCWVWKQMFMKNGNFVVKIYRCFTVKTVKISKTTW
jgi:hypothetical protein